MTLNVALKIDGDASGAKRALDEAARETQKLQTQTAAAGRAAQMQNAQIVQLASRHSQAAAAANAHAFATGNLNRQLAVARQTTALLLSQLGVGGFGSVAASAIASSFGPQGLLVLGLTAATAAAAGFWSTTNSGASRAESLMREHERLIGLVKDAYSGAANEAARFYKESKAVIEVGLLENLRQQREELERIVDQTTRRHVSPVFGTGDFMLPPGGTAMQLAGNETVNRDVQAFRDLIENFRAGRIGAIEYRDALSEIYKTQRETNPELARMAFSLSEAAAEADKQTRAIERNEAALRKLQGTASRRDEDLLGIARPKTEVSEFDRALASIQRQTVALEAQAETFGKSAAEAGRYRVEQELINAATAAGIRLNDQATAAIAALAERYGAAAGRLEELRQKQAEAEQAQQSFNAVAGGFFDALTGDIDNAGRALKRFIADLLLAEARAQFIRAFNPAAPLGPLSAIFAGIAHEGAVAGGAMPVRLVDASLFDRAPRFQAGLNKRGLGINEVPVIAHRGEVIGWPEQMREAFGGGRASVEIVIRVDEGGNIVPVVRRIAGEEADVRLERNNAFTLPREISERRNHSLPVIGRRR